MLLGYVLTGRKACEDVPEEEAVLKSLEREDVVPFLKRHLHWRILRVCVFITSLMYRLASKLTMG